MTLREGKVHARPWYAMSHPSPVPWRSDSVGESPAPERSLARIERVASIEPSDALTDLVHGARPDRDPRRELHGDRA